MSDFGKCRRCPAIMEWAITEAKGRRIPLERLPAVERDPAVTISAEPAELPGFNAKRGLIVDRGAGLEFVLANLRTVGERGGLPIVRNVSPGTGDRVPHHATCPAAKSFRKGRRT